MDITIAQAAQGLQDKKRVAILCHKSPDGDTTGSGFGLYYCLKQLGKEVRLLCADPLSKRFAAYLYQPDGNPDGIAVNEEGDLVTGLDFDTFDPDYIVSVDVADPQLLGSLESLYERVDLCLDHHRTNCMDLPDRVVDMTASAACEVIYQLLCELGVTLDTTIANAIYTGILTDTGCFQFSNTTPTTHRIAATLMEAGAEAEKINRHLFGTKTRTRIQVERMVLDGLEFFHDDRVAVAVITPDMVTASGLKEQDLDGVAGLPRQIEGVEAGVLVREKTDGLKVSLRTAQLVDASAVCALFGGGGHMRAAGCVFKEGTIEDVKAKLLPAIIAYL